MFVRGLRVVRILNIWPRLRGLAGPASDVPEPDIDPESNTGLELISIPAKTEVGHSGPSFSVLCLTFRSIRNPFTFCCSILRR